MEVGDRVVARLIFGENKSVRHAGADHVVVTSAVNKAVGGRAAKQVVVAGAGLQRGVAGAAEEQVAGAGPPVQNGAAGRAGMQQRIDARCCRQSHATRRGIDLDLVRIEKVPVREAGRDLELRIGAQTGSAACQEPAISLDRGRRMKNRDDPGQRFEGEFLKIACKPASAVRAGSQRGKRLGSSLYISPGLVIITR